MRCSSRNSIEMSRKLNVSLTTMKELSVSTIAIVVGMVSMKLLSMWMNVFDNIEAMGERTTAAKWNSTDHSHEVIPFVQLQLMYLDWTFV